MNYLGYSLLALGLGASLLAGSARVMAASSAELIEMDFEDLVNLDVQIESAGKSAKRALDLAYAGYVITASEIRSSGVQTIPDALRLAPGVDIGQISAAEWSIGIRGAAGRYSRYVLVMVDGRIAYNNAFSGVNWDELNINLEQIARIEVIRGPNGSSWGANAVNGIIHIITERPTTEQKQVVSAVAGGQGHRSVAGIWSSDLGEQWRIGLAANASQWDGLKDPDGLLQDGDHSNARLSLSALRDVERDKTYITADIGTAQQAPLIGYTDTETLQPGVGSSEEDKTMLSIQAMHTHQWNENHFWKIRTSAEDTQRDTWAFQWDSTNVQLETEYGGQWGGYSLLAGVYGRYNHSYVDLIEESGGSFEPANRSTFDHGVYLNNSLAIARLFDLSAGLRIDESELGGTNLQPSLRGLWKINETNRLWLAVSEAAVTPARSLTDVRNVPFQVVPAQGGNPPVLLVLNGYEDGVGVSSRLIAKELGYRVTFGIYSIDLAAFEYKYLDEIAAAPSGAPSFNPQTGVATQNFALNQNGAFASQGGELVLRGQPRSNWSTQLMLSYVENTKGNDLSSTTAVYSSTLDISDNLQWNFALRYNHGSTQTAFAENQNALIYGEVDDYLVADTTLRWSFSDHWQVDLIARNLGDEHAEALREQFTSPFLVVEPNALLKLNYRY